MQGNNKDSASPERPDSSVDSRLATQMRSFLFEVSANQLFESRDERIARSCRISRVHRKVGMAIAQTWELPETVSKCIETCDDYDSTDRLSVINGVRFANALAKRHGLYLGDFDKMDNAALITIGSSLLGMDEAVIAKLTEDLSVRVEQQLS